MLIKLLFIKHKKPWPGFCVCVFYFCPSEASFHIFSSTKKCLCHYLHSDVEKVHSAAENSLSFFTCSTITFLYFPFHLFSISTLCCRSVPVLLQPGSLSSHSRVASLLPSYFFWHLFVHSLFAFPPVISTVFQPGSVQVAFQERIELWSDSCRATETELPLHILNLGLNLVLQQSVD